MNQPNRMPETVAALLSMLREAVESLECAASDLVEIQFDEKEREKQAEFLADTAARCRQAIFAYDNEIKVQS